MKILSFISLFVLGLSIQLSSLASEGSGSSVRGGGDAIVCKNQTYLADTFEIFHKNSVFMSGNQAKFFVLNQLRKEKVQEIFLTALSKNDIELAREIRHILDNVLEFHFTTKPLEELDDDNIHIPGITLKLRCKKRQLAVQDRSTGNVLVNSLLYNSLSPVEQATLEIHEAFIFSFGPTHDTSPIRKIVQDVMNSNEFLKKIFRDIHSSSGKEGLYNAALVTAKFSMLAKFLSASNNPDAFFTVTSTLKKRSAYEFSIDWWLLGDVPPVAAEQILRSVFYGELINQFDAFGLCQNRIPSKNLPKNYFLDLYKIENCWKNQSDSNECSTAEKLAMKYGSYICNAK